MLCNYVLGVYYYVTVSTLRPSTNANGRCNSDGQCALFNLSTYRTVLEKMQMPLARPWFDILQGRYSGDDFDPHSGADLRLER